MDENFCVFGDMRISFCASFSVSFFLMGSSLMLSDVLKDEEDTSLMCSVSDPSESLICIATLASLYDVRRKAPAMAPALSALFLAGSAGPASPISAPLTHRYLG